MGNVPNKSSEARLCLALTKAGLTAYGNSAAFTSLAEWMLWLASSEPARNFECHATAALETDDSKFNGHRPRNVWPLFEVELRGAFPPKSDDNPGFELTFMMVDESALDTLAERQAAETLPEGWASDK